MLAELAVDRGAELQGGGIREPVARDDPGPERAEAVTALGAPPLSVASLLRPRRDVVGDGVAQDAGCLLYTSDAADE